MSDTKPDFETLFPIYARVRFSQDGRRYMIVAHTASGAILAKPNDFDSHGRRYNPKTTFHARWEAIREMQ